MGNTAHFTEIERKYGQDGVDYVAFRYHERKNYLNIKDNISRLKDHANLQQQEHIQFLEQQIRQLEKTFKNAQTEAEAAHKGSIKQAEVHTKSNVETFSGYTEELNKLRNLQHQINQKYDQEKTKMEKTIRDELAQKLNKSKLKGITEFDIKSDGQRRDIENECIRRHPQKANQADAIDFERRLSWENYRQNFDAIFNKGKAASDAEAGRNLVRQNILPNKAPVCC